MNSTILIRNVASVSWAKEKTALNLSRVYAIWMKEITGMKVEHCIGRRRWHREMSAAIFMLQGLRDSLVYKMKAVLYKYTKVLNFSANILFQS